MGPLSSIGLIFWIIGFIFWLIIFGFGTAWVAGERGRDRITWGIIGFFIGFFALIFLAITPVLEFKDD